MDSHPIPQNITSFEFHLVGDMTLKQFGYLASGLAIAYLTFVLFYSASPILAIVIIIISSLLGVVFAFIPIQDRSLDHWLVAFFKAVYSPTRRTIKISSQQQPLLKNRLKVYFNQIHPNKGSSFTVHSSSVVQPVSPATPSTISSFPTDAELEKTVELAKQAQLVQSQIIGSEKQLDQIKHLATAPGADRKLYQNELSTLLDNLRSLIEKAQLLSTQISQLNRGEPALNPLPQTTTVPNIPQPKAVTRAEVKVVEPPKVKSTQIFLTSLPNVINGIVTDSTGNYLEGVVVVIHNKDGLPVRASKTNKLGQFAGATPLADGEYTISLEKDNLLFDSLQVTLKGEVLSPLYISAKKKGVN